MKIISQDTNHLVTSDKSTLNLVIGIIISIVGLAIAYQGFSSHTSETIIGGVAIFLLALVFGVIFKKTRILTLDKQAGQANLAISSMGRHRQLSYSITSIQKVHQTTKFNTQVGGQAVNLLLIMNDGTSVIVASANQGWLSSGATKTASVVGQAIATFLDLPFDHGTGVVGLGKEIASTAINPTPDNNVAQVTPQPEPPLKPTGPSNNDQLPPNPPQ